MHILLRSRQVIIVLASILLLLATTSAAALSVSKVAHQLKERALDGWPALRPSEDTVQAAVEHGLSSVAAQHAPHYVVFGVDVSGMITEATIKAVAGGMKTWLATTRGILGSYWACHRACRTQGGPKGSPDEPLTCKGACEALHGQDLMKRASNFLHACGERDRLHPAVLAVYDQAQNWCRSPSK